VAQRGREVLLALPCVGCHPIRGTPALAWLLFAGCAAVFAAVVAAVLWAAFRPADRRARTAARPDAERRVAAVAGGATAGTLLVVFGLLLASVATSRGLGQPPAGEPLAIEVVGHRWWWDVRYPDGPSGGNAVAVTANEIHVPVGRPVRISVTSEDASGPRTSNGKLDLIPGHHAPRWLLADRFERADAGGLGARGVEDGLDARAAPRAGARSGCRRGVRGTCADVPAASRLPGRAQPARRDQARKASSGSALTTWSGPTHARRAVATPSSMLASSDR
jgi:hypothetical protein